MHLLLVGWKITAASLFCRTAQTALPDGVEAAFLADMARRFQDDAVGTRAKIEALVSELDDGDLIAMVDRLETPDVVPFSKQAGEVLYGTDVSALSSLPPTVLWPAHYGCIVQVRWRLLHCAFGPSIQMDRRLSLYISRCVCVLSCCAKACHNPQQVHVKTPLKTCWHVCHCR